MPILDGTPSTVDLNKKTAKGAAVTMTRSALNAVLQMMAIPILARLLTTDDYGIMTMATSTTGLAALFGNAGLGSATVQKENVSREYLNSMFWFSTGVGLILTVVTALLAPAVAWFFGEPRLIPVVIVLGLAFFISGLAIQHQAILTRNLKFLELAIIEISVAACSFVGAVSLAWFGFGYWALVAVVPVAGLIKTLSVWSISDWSPRRPALSEGVSESLLFGANVTGFSFLNYFVRRGDDIIIGHYFGTSTLGLYNRAYSLLTLPLAQFLAPLGQVMIPVLSRLQSDPTRFNRFYGQANLITAYVVTPFVIFLVLYPEDCVVLILGDKWLEAVPLVRMLAIGGILQPLVSPIGWVFVSTGKPGLHLRWAAFASPVFILSFLIGAIFGVHGVAVGFTVSATLNGIGSLLYASKYTILDLRSLLSDIALPYLLNGAIFLLLLVPRVFLPEAGFFRTGISMICIMISYFVFFILHQEERQRMLSIRSLLSRE